jgi:teichuronic acid biosynthesis glycosyltransferase TuaC
VKRHDLLIQGFAQASQQSPGLRLYIVGDGPLLPGLEAQVNTMALRERIFLVGGRPNDELCLWFNAADVSCLASVNEGWPNVLMESIACGTPVVATNVGGIPEIVNSPELGRLVDGDPMAFSEGILAALNQEWNRALLARHVQQRDWTSVAQQVQKFMTSKLDETIRK